MNYRQGASAFIINDKKEFLMVLAAKKDSTEPDYWKIPAGGVEGNEDLETALKREMLEEIGILENDLEVLAKSKHTDKFTWPKEISQRKQKETGVWYDGQERCIFICKLKTADYKFKLQEEEIADVKWFNKEDYEKHLLFPSQVELMKKVIEEFKDYF